MTTESETETVKDILEKTDTKEDEEKQPRIISLYGSVEEEKCEELVLGLVALEAMAKEDDAEVKFVISSEGGEAYNMLSVYDAVRSLRKKVEIETYGLGRVMSAAVLLLAAGTKGKRKIGRHCRVMIHEVKAGQSGTIYVMKRELEEVEKLEHMYIKCLARESELTEEQIVKMFESRTNIYLSAEQAVQYGIADIIV